MYLSEIIQLRFKTDRISEAGCSQNKTTNYVCDIPNTFPSDNLESCTSRSVAASNYIGVYREGKQNMIQNSHKPIKTGYLPLSNGFFLSAILIEF